MSNIEPTPFGDKYVLVEHIATGGMAEIYRAHYAGIEGFAKELVVKTLREEFAARPDVVAMFLDEARVAATLTHNNVVHTYDLGELGGEYFIAMELLKGEELVNVMRRAHQVGRPISLALALGIIMQSCEGLHYVHSRTDEHGRPLGLVHRDINPTNIHVGYDGACKILDFGIAATRASAVAKKGQVAGKLSYMAPEQLQGQPIDHRADIFPLGVVLYELVLGRRLFRGPREEVTRRVIEGDIEPPTFVQPDFPPALEAVIMKALEVDPAERYQNCDHMFRDLEAFMQDEGLSWTPRKLSAMMADLFGEGAPAEIDYDDQYDDLVDEALDFDALERAADDEDDDAPPAWAQGLEAASTDGSSRRKRAMTIGNLEALVGQRPISDSGPQDVVASRADPAQGSGPSARPLTPKSSGHHKVISPRSDASEERKRASSGPRRSTGHPPSGANKRPGTGPRRSVSPSGARASLMPSGPRPSLAPTGSYGATAGPASGGFGSAVVTERSNKGTAIWGWVLGTATVGGLGYIAYTLFTTQ